MGPFISSLKCSDSGATDVFMSEELFDSLYHRRRLWVQINIEEVAGFLKVSCLDKNKNGYVNVIRTIEKCAKALDKIDFFAYWIPTYEQRKHYENITDK